MDLTCTRYTSEHQNLWNAFLTESANGTFLFHRSFMDYHADRFMDHSVMVFKGTTLVALFPAHEKDDVIYSHKGLTYGGMIIRSHLTTTTIFSIQDVLREYYSKLGCKAIYIKDQPHIYNMGNNGVASWPDATIQSMQHNMYVDLQNYKVSSKKAAGYRHGKFEQLTLVTETDFTSFWNTVLIPSLKNRYGTVPVHSLSEIKLLHSRFPDLIFQENVYFNNELVAGVTFFSKNKVLKSQYAAATSKGFSLRAMDFIYMEMMNWASEQGYQYMDYGTVNHPDGTINKGLQRFKTELGCQEEHLHHYCIPLKL